MKARANVNVTLGDADWFRGKTFPCPVCSSDLLLKLARTQKPYCHCDACGIQLFFRGKNGIRELRRLLSSGVVTPKFSRATVLWNRLHKLKSEKNQLEDQQGIFLRDRDLDQAIRVIDLEIESVRRELAQPQG